MKKFLIIGLIIALALIVVGGAGVAYAQYTGLSRNIINPLTVAQNTDGVIRQFNYGPGGMMGEYGYGPGGMMGGYGHGNMMGGYGYGYGPGSMMGERGFEGGQGHMHEYMISAFAEAVGLTVDEVNTRLSNGDSFREIALAQGKTEADLPALFTQVRQAALDKAVADGAITQAQADWMLEHMSNYRSPGSGPGYGMEDCPMWDGQ